jgi:hypothetical protein
MSQGEVRDGVTNRPPDADAPTEAAGPAHPAPVPDAPTPRIRRRRATLEVDPLDEPETPRALRNAIDRLVWDIVDRKDDDRS